MAYRELSKELIREISKNKSFYGFNDADILRR